jgi:hypothetical protein
MPKIAASSTKPKRELIADIDVCRLQIVCWIAFIAVAVVRAWFTRYELMGGDSLAYLDIARAVAEGHFGIAIHACWSPAYPVLLSLFLWLFRPSVYWEAPLVHFVNVLIFIGTLIAFRLFWNEVFHWHRIMAEDRDAEITKPVFLALGYAVFSIAALNVIRIGLIAPDMLVAAFCLLAGWAAIRFRRGPGIGRALILGIVLASGYYAKSPFLLIGFVFVLCACFWWPVSGRAILLGGLALLTFLFVCAPFIAALSLAKGRLTFGETARLNEAFFIDGVQFYEHWQGGPPGAGMPIHPTHKLNAYPEIYEFAQKNMGTYPPWFDPTYWYEGITPHFILKRQVIVFMRNLALTFQIILESGTALVCVVIILVLLTGFRKHWIRGLSQLWFMWVPGLAALTMYALIHDEPRYLGGWLMLLFAGAISACSLPTDAGTRRAVRCIAIATLITAGVAVILQASREAVGIDYTASRTSRNAAIAGFLLSNGLHPGDGIALIGNGSEAYWAHLARLHLVAEIPAYITSRPGHPSLDFWESRTEQQRMALEILQRTGARAVIAGSQDSLAASVPSTVPPPWEKIGRTGAYIYFFPANQ